MLFSVLGHVFLDKYIDCSSVMFIKEYSVVSQNHCEMQRSKYNAVNTIYFSNKFM